MAREYDYKDRKFVVEKVGEFGALVNSKIMINPTISIHYIGNDQWKTVTDNHQMITDTFIEGVNYACKVLAKIEDKRDEINEFFLGDSF